MICKSLRKGEDDRPRGEAGFADGWGAFEAKAEGLAGWAAGCTLAKLEKRDFAELASGVWVWLLREENGLGVCPVFKSGFVCR